MKAICLAVLVVVALLILVGLLATFWFDPHDPLE